MILINDSLFQMNFKLTSTLPRTKRAMHLCPDRYTKKNWQTEAHVLIRVHVQRIVIAAGRVGSFHYDDRMDSWHEEGLPKRQASFQPALECLLLLSFRSALIEIPSLNDIPPFPQQTNYLSTRIPYNGHRTEMDLYSTAPSTPTPL